MAKVCVFTADGFEEVEGLTVVDLLRRAGAEVLMVSISDNLSVTGSHGIEIKADVFLRMWTTAQWTCWCCPEACREPNIWERIRDLRTC